MAPTSIDSVLTVPEVRYHWIPIGFGGVLVYLLRPHHTDLVRSVGRLGGGGDAGSEEDRRGVVAQGGPEVVAQHTLGLQPSPQEVPPQPPSLSRMKQNLEIATDLLKEPEQRIPEGDSGFTFCDPYRKN